MVRPCLKFTPSGLPLLSQKNRLLTQATQDLEVDPQRTSLSTPDLAPLPPTLSCLICLRLRTCHSLCLGGPCPTCPLPTALDFAHLTSTQPLDPSPDITSSTSPSQHPPTPPSQGSPCTSPISVHSSPVVAPLAALSFSFPSSLSLPPSFHRAPSPCQLWGHKDRHGPSRNSESSRENRLVKITQMQMKSCV